jgi:hypothetical protein
MQAMSLVGIPSADFGQCQVNAPDYEMAESVQQNLQEPTEIERPEHAIAGELSTFIRIRSRRTIRILMAPPALQAVTDLQTAWEGQVRSKHSRT